jgi:branched-chain amino acid transport system ATP-binding protein
VSARLELRGVRAGYGRLEVLHGIDMVLPFGATVALVGPNGGGKSTLLHVLAGLVRVRAGEVLLDGAAVPSGPAHRRAAAGFTLVPGDRNVFPSLTVAETLRLFGAGGSIEPVLDVFPELAPLLDRRGEALWGGERQWVALAHGLLRPGRVLMVDELSQGLSPGARRRAYAALAALAAPDRLIVLVEQYIVEALALADLVYVLDRGRLRFAGEPTELELTGMAPPAGAQPAR